MDLNQDRIEYSISKMASIVKNEVSIQLLFIVNISVISRILHKTVQCTVYNVCHIAKSLMIH